MIFGTGASAPQEECTVSTRTVIRSLETACEVFEVDTGRYPTEQQGLMTLLRDPDVTNWSGPYIRTPDNSLPTDFWEQQFRYRLVGGKPVIDSAGPDGIFGTKDDNGKNWKPKARTTGCSRTR